MKKYGGFRKPQTTNERRRYYGDEDEDEVDIRPSRRARNLPNSFDDIPRSSWTDRSWKKNHKTKFNKGKEQ